MGEVVIGGLIGALAALVGQIVAGVFEARRHRVELGFRQKELWAQLVGSTVASRSIALERAFELIQRAIDVGRIGTSEYEEMRQTLVYLPDSIATPLVLQLQAQIKAGAADPKTTQALKCIQDDIRQALGLDDIDAALAGGEKSGANRDSK